MRRRVGPRSLLLGAPCLLSLLACPRQPDTESVEHGSSSTGEHAEGTPAESSGEDSSTSGIVSTTSGSSSTGSSTSTTTTSTGTSSSTGTTGTGTDPDTGDASSGEDSETGGSASDAQHPFPRNAPSDYCVYPTIYDNADVRIAYARWKETVVTADGAGGFLRVRKPDSGTVIGSTVSEGIGYGMLLAVYMDDQEVFDNLWQYTRLYLNENGLMHWEIDPQGRVIGTGAALDGDEDIAWALVMADRQWGGSGSLQDTYLNYALDLIDAMWTHEIDHGRGEMPLPGDSWQGADITNISYFAPAYYRVFGEVSGNVEGWNAVIDRSYEILELSLTEANGNAENGLVPAWCNSNGELRAHDGAPLHFQNDSTRTPFRIGQDYCYYGEPRARAYLEKITSFYTEVGVENIVDGYELDGTPRPEFSMNGSQAASFVGPAGVGAMFSTEHQAFIDDTYAAVASGELTAGTIYYQQSWMALSLLMMSGNFTELPAP